MFRAETDEMMQFPPEIISTKLSKSLHHNIIQTLVVLGNVIDVALALIALNDCERFLQVNCSYLSKQLFQTSILCYRE